MTQTIDFNHLPARAPHKAMAVHVAEFGTEAAQDLYASAREFNQTYFGGQLAEVFIEIASPGSPNAYATHQPRTPEGVACMVRIAPSVVTANREFALDCLLHEMIHVWQSETDNREPGYQGHGPKFAAKCNEIGAKLGLPEVAAKGKDGKPDCAQWPLNVRPEGFYGQSPKAVKAVSKAVAPKGSRRRASATAAKQSALAVALEAVAQCNQTERALIAAAIAAGAATIAASN